MPPYLPTLSPPQTKNKHTNTALPARSLSFLHNH